MAERKSGAGKPPVIDLKAREAALKPEDPIVEDPAVRPETQDVPLADPGPIPDDPPVGAPAAESAELPRAADAIPPTQPRPPARLAMPWSAISIAAAGGAVLGTLLTYLVGTWIALPSKGPAFPDPTAAVADLDTRADGLESRVALLDDFATKTRLGLDATVTQLDSGLGALRAAITAVEGRIQPPVAVDLTGIEQQVSALAARVDAIAAGASSADAGAMVDRLGGIETELAALASRLNEVATAATTQQGLIATLTSELDATRTSIAAQAQTLGGADIGPAVKLPLLLSGLESAFAAGRPYAAELTALTTLLPDLAVPAPLQDAAAEGLPRPDALEARFAEVLPQIIAGRTAQPTGDWSVDALEWAKALLALRPVGEVEGNTPEASISRLESAVGRHDFVAAAAELAALPEPMRNAAGAVGTDIAALAAAETFVAGLRVQALTPATAEATP